uniref:Secreted protein n=1 Tax=Oryzias latipes TaxID=8090 RepID=A0A3P9GYY3_ORYLA
MRVFCAVVSTSCVVSEMGLVVGCQVVVENMVFAPTCVHGPTPEERSIPVYAPAMASRMLPRNLEDVLFSFFRGLSPSAPASAQCKKKMSHSSKVPFGLYVCVCLFSSWDP